MSVTSEVMCALHSKLALSFVIASQRVRANARPDDRLREAIQTVSEEGFWIASLLFRPGT